MHKDPAIVESAAITAQPLDLDGLDDLDDLDLGPLDLGPLDDLDPPAEPVTGRRLPKPKALQGLKPRNRRSKAEMQAAREAIANVARIDAECDALAARLREATSGQIFVAERTIRRWSRFNRGKYGK